MARHNFHGSLENARFSKSQLKFAIFFYYICCVFTCISYMRVSRSPNIRRINRSNRYELERFWFETDRRYSRDFRCKTFACIWTISCGKKTLTFWYGNCHQSNYGHSEQSTLGHFDYGCIFCSRPFILWYAEIQILFFFLFFTFTHKVESMRSDSITESESKQRLLYAWRLFFSSEKIRASFE